MGFPSENLRSDRGLGTGRGFMVPSIPFLPGQSIAGGSRNAGRSPGLVGGVEVGWYPLSVVERGGQRDALDPGR